MACVLSSLWDRLEDAATSVASSYDNTKLAVTCILGDGKRQRTRAFTKLQ
jgi:hypothetical protein